MDTILLNQSSNALILLYTLPTLCMAKANNHARKITGSPVAIAKIIGKYNPLTLAIEIGISIAKYRTPLYGQNARANTTPKRKLPQ